MKKSDGYPPVIGWREWVSLPDIGIEFIKAKVDTGARSSALHVVGLREYERDGVNWVRFTVHPLQRRTSPEIEVDVKVEEHRLVRSSNGKVAMRPLIVTRLALMDVVWNVELTLASRDEMGFRMLLGREAFRSRFLVDASRSYYGGIPVPVRKRSKRKTNTETAQEP